MTCFPFESKWFSEQAQKEASRDILGLGDRVGEAVSIVVSVVMIAFVAIHQTRPTGFFTGDSGGVAAAVIYALLVFGMVAPALRLFLGRRNVVRPFEAANLGVFVAGGLYLLAAFPFDITRLAQPLPYYMEFLLDWVPESLAKLVLGLAAVVSAFVCPYTFLMYLRVKEALSAKAPEAAPENGPAE
ncbi:MAG: hypothetical protein AB7S97_01570 [Thermoplasmata archaeon]